MRLIKLSNIIYRQFIKATALNGIALYRKSLGRTISFKVATFTNRLIYQRIDKISIKFKASQFSLNSNVPCFNHKYASCSCLFSKGRDN